MLHYTTPNGKVYDYVLVPNGSNGRIVFDNDPNKFMEYTAAPGGVFNFTGVNGTPDAAITVQSIGSDGNVSSVRGITGDIKDYDQRMKDYLQKLFAKDPQKLAEWMKMFNPDGSISSAKMMANLNGDLQKYIDGTFCPGFQGRTIYVTPQFYGQIVKKEIPNPSYPPKAGQPKTINAWVFQPDPNCPECQKDPKSKADVPLPYMNGTDRGIQGWVSGANGDSFNYDPKTGKYDIPAYDYQSSRWDYRCNPMAAQVAMGLSSVFNQGLKPSDVVTSAQNSLTTPDYFTDINTAVKSHEADFYNVYLLAMHAGGGCTAYGADYDDLMGGAGAVSESLIDGQTSTMVISFKNGGSSPTPPAPGPGPDDVLKKYPDVKALHDQEVLQMKGVIRNEGTHGPNMAWYTEKHTRDYHEALNRHAVKDAAKIAEELFSLELKEAGGSTPPSPQKTIHRYKDALSGWLDKNEPGYDGHDPKTEGYLRRTYADPIFGQIDSGAIKDVKTMQGWIENHLQGLFSSNIYKADPKLTESLLGSLYKTLGLSNPVPKPPGPPQPTKGIDVQIMTYNIRTSDASYGIDGKNAHDWGFREDKVVNNIAGNTIDDEGHQIGHSGIVGLQESTDLQLYGGVGPGGKQYEGLQQKLAEKGLHYDILTPKDSSGKVITSDSSMLIDTSKYDVVSQAGVYMGPGYKGGPTAAIVVTLRDKASGKEFVVANSHFSPSGAVPPECLNNLNVEIAKQQTAAAGYDKTSADKVPTFFVGDLNGWEGDHGKVANLQNSLDMNSKNKQVLAPNQDITWRGGWDGGGDTDGSWTSGGARDDMIYGRGFDWSQTEVAIVHDSKKPVQYRIQKDDTSKSIAGSDHWPMIIRTHCPV